MVRAVWLVTCNGAGDEARTRYLHLGKVALYRMSYTRISVPNGNRGASGRNRTNDTRIFSPLLYLLSYRGMLSRAFRSAQMLYLATRNGLEPSTSSVTGWRANRLHHRAKFGGNNRARTCDPMLVRHVLSQLSYAPEPAETLLHLSDGYHYN